ncbi:MAG TPA: glycosyltransferase family 4 protein [bacterium]|nr:glycosyltransferase family 4 protein [bacterium]
MKVLHVINTAEVGGGAEHLILLAQGLVGHGWRSTVVVGRDGPAGARLAAAGVPVQRLGPMGATTLLSLPRVLRAQRPDLVHLHGSRAGLLGTLSARWAGVRPVVYTAHALAFRREDYPILRKVFVLAERTTCALADHVIYLTEGDLSAARKAGITTSHATVIPNGVDLARFTVDGDRKALGIAQNVPVIGMVARLVPQKDPMTFLDAARLVADVFPHAKFLLIGDGPLRPRVEAAVRARGLEGQCLVLGTRQDVPQLLQAMDVVLLTSRWEGLALAALEAMAAAKPLVASQLPGLSAVIENGLTGVLVRAGDAPEFARAAIALISDASRRTAMGTRGQRRVAEHFSLEGMVASTERVYRSALAVSGSPADLRTT